MYFIRPSCILKGRKSGKSCSAVLNLPLKQVDVFANSDSVYHAIDFLIRTIQKLLLCAQIGDAFWTMLLAEHGLDEGGVSWNLIVNC
jgi:hypothetical protein